MVGRARAAALAAILTTIGLGLSAAPALGYPCGTDECGGFLPPAAPNPGPSVSGSTLDGSTLTGDNGGWAGEGTIVSPSFTYSWFRCDSAGASCDSTPVAGATGTTYDLTTADIGRTLRFRVRATTGGVNFRETDAQPSAVVQARPPANTAPPTASGTARLGQTLTGTDGTWTGTDPISFSHQWQRCDAVGANCEDIGEATQLTYTAVRADVGATLRLVVTADNAAPGDVSASSDATARVEGAPLNQTLPQVSGTARRGDTLTADSGTWSGFPAPAFTYQWVRCNSGGTGCGDVSGATGTSYALASADVGQRLKVRVTATNPLGASSAESALSAVVTAAPVNTVAPTISGDAVRDATLTANPGAWTGSPLPSFSYQWRRCDSSGANCNDIGGATSTTYTTVDADVGSTLRVVVTATNTAGSVSATSAATNPVVSPPENTAPPTVTGAPKVGQPLTGADGTWTGTPTISFSYRWVRCNSTGSGCILIPGVTTRDYTPTASDAGKRLKLRVTASNAAPDPVAVDSALTSVVEGPPTASFSFSPTRPVRGRPIDFTGTALDPDGGTLALDWDLDDDGNYDDDDGPTARTTFSSAGSHIVRLRVTDDEANVVVVSRTVRVVAPAAPAPTPTPKPPAFNLPGPLTPTPGPLPVRPAFLDPFPIVRIAGRATRRGARITVFAIRAPRGSLVRVRCKGGRKLGCKYKRVTKHVGRKRRVRIKGLQRRLRARAVIEVRVTRKGKVGKFTRFRIRRGKAPARRDMCLAPGSTKPTGCGSLR